MIWPRVIGQQRVKEALLSALKNDRLPHAYLFHGNAGVGKDAMAIELARVIHCETGSFEPCGVCGSCVRINSLQHPDVRLVTALPVGRDEDKDDSPLTKLLPDDINAIREQFRIKAENAYHRLSISRATIIKINSIREVRRESSLSTTDGRKRVFIISNADEMGDEASNTILKTLEEPSGKTMLILTTAHRDALLPTITSRCQAVRFDPLTEQDLASALVERNGIDSDNAMLIARLANGSYGRAQELLHEDLSKQRQDVLSFIKRMLGTNIMVLMKEIEEISNTRDHSPINRFLGLMLIWFRDALVLARGGTIINLDQEDDLKRFVAKFPEANLTQVLADIERAIFLVERNVYIKLVLLQLMVKLRRSILTGVDGSDVRLRQLTQ